MENNNYEEISTQDSEFTYVSANDPAVLQHANESFSKMGISIFEIMMVATALQLLLALTVQKAFPDLMQSQIMMWVVTFLPIYAVAMPVGIKMLQRVESYPVQKRSFSAGNLIRAFLVCIFLMYMGNMIGIMITSLINGGTSLNPLDALAASDSMFAKVLVTVIIAPLLEELIFRKLLIDRINVYGERLAVVTSALMFALFHGNLSQFFYTYFLGLVFGYVYLRSGRLIYSAILHMAVNFMGMVLAPALLVNVDLETLEAISAEKDPEAMMAMLTPEVVRYMIFSSCIMIAFIAGFIIFMKVRKKLTFEPAVLELPREVRRRTVWRNSGMLALLIGCLALVIFNTVAGVLVQ